MHTRRASYSPTTTRVDREGSPERRKLEEASPLPVFPEGNVSEPNDQVEENFESTSDAEEDKSKADNVNPNDESVSANDAEDEDALIERLLRKAEENLSSHDSNNQITPRARLDPGPLPKPYFESTKNGNRLLTDQLEDSVVIIAHSNHIKRLAPQKSKSEHKKAQEATAGQKWFDMPATELTPTIKRDLTLLQMRNVLDPKRHYRASAKTLPKYFQMGTIVESPTEFFSARIKKKDRKETIVQELLADQKSRDYFKRKFNEIQEKSVSGGKRWYKKMQERRKQR